jgi:hypothetical protein
LSLHRHKQRHDAWRQFASIMFLCLHYINLSSIRNILSASRRPTSVCILSYNVSMPLLTWSGIEAVVVAVGVMAVSVVSISCRVVRHPEAHLLYVYEICRRCENRRRHAWRRFFSVVSWGIPWLISEKIRLDAATTAVLGICHVVNHTDSPVPRKKCP